MQILRLRVIEFARIEAGKNVYLIPRVGILVDVYFVVNRKRQWKGLHRGERRILHNHGRIELPPRMVIEEPADHVTEFGPREESIVSRMRGNETLAILVDK